MASNIDGHGANVAFSSSSPAVRLGIPDLVSEMASIRHIHDSILEVRYDDAFYSMLSTDKNCICIAAYMRVEDLDGAQSASDVDQIRKFPDCVGDYTMVGVTTARAWQDAPVFDVFDYLWEGMLTTVGAITYPVTALWSSVRAALGGRGGDDGKVVASASASPALANEEKDSNSRSFPTDSTASMIPMANTASSSAASSTAASMMDDVESQPPPPSSSAASASASMQLSHKASSSLVTKSPPLLRKSRSGTGYIMTLAVRAVARRRGVGTALVCGIVDELDGTFSQSKVTLDCLASNDVARRMYERCGFILVRYLPSHYYFNSAYHDGLHMSLNLETSTARIMTVST